MKPGHPGSKRHKYMYFEQILFLIPLTKHHATSSNYSPLTGSNGEEGTEKRKRMHKVQAVENIQNFYVSKATARK
jgi:hypothetical protein